MRISCIKKSACLGGYFTVEAAVLMPFLLALTFLFTYSLIYIYNLTLLTQDTYYTCEKVREAILENEDPQIEAGKVYSALKKESPYVSCENLSMKYSKSGYKIYVDSKAKFRIPIKSFLGRFFNPFNEKMNVEEYTYITKPQNIMRMSYIIKER